MKGYKAFSKKYNDYVYFFKDKRIAKLFVKFHKDQEISSIKNIKDQMRNYINSIFRINKESKIIYHKNKYKYYLEIDTDNKDKAIKLATKFINTIKNFNEE